MMIERTDDEIDAKVRAIYKKLENGKDYYDGEFKTDKPKSFEVKISRIDDGVNIEIARMYAYVPLTFAILMELAEFFGTKNIGEGYKDKWDGCESCDYGSKYMLNLVVRSEEN
jgi:hypothetical protein